MISLETLRGYLRIHELCRNRSSQKFAEEAKWDSLFTIYKLKLTTRICNIYIDATPIRVNGQVTKYNIYMKLPQTYCTTP